MKTIPYAIILLLATLGVARAASDTKITSAQITELYQTATLREQEQVRPAQINDQVMGNRVLQTGTKSRAELQFNDQSLARLGANTVFSFQPESRQFNFEKGTLLFQVPKNRGTTRIATPAASCAVTGTTVQLLQVGTRAVYMVLEGTMEVSVLGKIFSLKEGQALVITNPNTEPEIVGIDVSTILATSNLIREFKTKLPSENLIAEVVKKQSGYQFTVLDGVYDSASDTDSKNAGTDVRRDIPTDLPSALIEPSAPPSRDEEQLPPLTIGPSEG